MQRMKATDWLERYFCPDSQPSESWLRTQLRTGELPGEKLGGVWFVHVKDGSAELDYGKPEASNDAQTAALALIEDWKHGAA